MRENWFKMMSNLPYALTSCRVLALAMAILISFSSADVSPVLALLAPAFALESAISALIAQHGGGRGMVRVRVSHREPTHPAVWPTKTEKLGRRTCTEGSSGGPGGLQRLQFQCCDKGDGGAWHSSSLCVRALDDLLDQLLALCPAERGFSILPFLVLNRDGEKTHLIGLQAPISIR